MAINKKETIKKVIKETGKFLGKSIPGIFPGISGVLSKIEKGVKTQEKRGEYYDVERKYLLERRESDKWGEEQRKKAMEEYRKKHKKTLKYNDDTGKMEYMY